jgi:hypothetical protein
MEEENYRELYGYIARGSIKKVSNFFKKYPDFDINFKREIDKMTPLNAAIYFENEDLALWLLKEFKKTIDVHIHDMDEVQPIAYAINVKLWKVVDKLIEMGADYKNNKRFDRKNEYPKYLNKKKLGKFADFLDL